MKPDISSSVDTHRRNPWRLCIGLIWLVTLQVCGFPLDQFKNFVNTKPTIERLEFNYRGMKYKISGVDEGTFRRFALIYEAGTGFSLFEDRSEFGTYRTRFFSGSYKDQYWHLFNSNDIVTTVSDKFKNAPHGKNGPSGVCEAKLGTALDCLNLGIFDLGNNGVHWEGLTFTCLSNLIGARIDGELTLDASGSPVILNLKYEYRGSTNSYRVNYEFDRSPRLPEFFPSRVEIVFVSGSQIQKFSDYGVTSLVLSDRELTMQDLDYRKWLATNSPARSEEFVFTNNSLYAVAKFQGRIQLKRVLNKDEDVHLGSNWPRWLVLILFLTASALTVWAAKHK